MEQGEISVITIKHCFGLIGVTMVSAALAGCGSNTDQMAQAAPPAATAPAPQPPAAPPPAPAPTPMTHQQLIQSVQTALNSHGAKLTVDGRMGRRTAVALRSFQHQQNLPVTGRPDKATLKALDIQS